MPRLPPTVSRHPPSSLGLTHVARSSISRLQGWRGPAVAEPEEAGTAKDAAAWHSFCFTCHVFKRREGRWVERRGGFLGLEHRPRIITDQISDISRGMNVLWCVFYFISLSYNPPSSGTRRVASGWHVLGAGWWGGAVLCAWLTEVQGKCRMRN